MGATNIQDWNRDSKDFDSNALRVIQAEKSKINDFKETQILEEILVVLKKIDLRLEIVTDENISDMEVN